MSTSHGDRLTIGELHWLLDPEDPDGAAAVAPLSSLPDRILQLDALSEEEKARISNINHRVTLPTRLLAGYERVTLLSCVSLPPNMQSYMKQFVESLVRNICVMTSLTFQLPSPMFHSYEHFRLETLIPSHRIDLNNIAYDAKSGDRLTLNQDQQAFSDLKLTGVYKRGDYHITFGWYPGRLKIKHWLHEALAETWYQWSVELPSTIVGREHSVLLGLWQLVSGIVITCNRPTGLFPTMFPKYTATEIANECSKEYFRWLEGSQGFVLTSTEVIDIGHAHKYHPHTSSSQVERYPVIFKHPTRGYLDFRTFVPPIRRELMRILELARQATEAKMNVQRMAIISSLSKTMNVDDAIQRYLELWQDAYIGAIQDRRHAIDSLSSFPNLTATVIEEERARVLVARLKRSKRGEREDRIERAVNLWKRSHPLTASSGKFVARHSAKVTAEAEDAVPLYDGLQEVLKETNELSTVVLLLDTQDEFELSDILVKRKKELEAARQPRVLEVVFFKIPSRWTVEQRHMLGETFYELEFVRTVKLLSSVPLWRLQLFCTRYFSWIWNSSFYLVNNASIALRRWNPFCERFEIRLPSVNRSTGGFDKAPVRTLRGRLAALVEWKQKIIQEARTGEHIIRLRQGLYLDTCWAHFWTSLGVGLGGASTVCYTTLETIAVVAGASAALVTSPVWSLIGNVGRSVFNTFVYDLELDDGEESRSPLFRNVFGLPNILLSSLRSALHVLTGSACAVGGVLRHSWNLLWHGIMTSLLRHAEVPTQAEGFFWSTSGPGMKNPFVLIDADTAMLAVLAFLSQNELKAARKEMHASLGEPRRMLEERVQDDSARSMRLDEIRLISNALSSMENGHRDDLDGFWRLAETERQYGELLRGVRGNTQIRMEADELMTFTAQALHVVKKFYLERYFPRLSSLDVIKFWESHNRVPGDWQGLLTDVMTSIFTNEIVVPFEAASEDLVVDANRVSGLETIIGEALEEQGVVTGETTNYNIGHPIQIERIPHAPSHEDLPFRFLPQPIG